MEVRYSISATLRSVESRGQSLHKAGKRIGIISWTRKVLLYQIAEHVFQLGVFGQAEQQGVQQFVFFQSHIQRDASADEFQHRLNLGLVFGEGEGVIRQHQQFHFHGVGLEVLVAVSAVGSCCPQRRYFRFRDADLLIGRAGVGLFTTKSFLRLWGRDGPRGISDNGG